MLNLAGRLGEGFSLAIDGEHVGMIFVVGARRQWVELSFDLKSPLTVRSADPDRPIWRAQNQWFRIYRGSDLYAAIGVVTANARQAELCFDIPSELRIARTRADGSTVTPKPRHAGERSAVEEGHRR